MNIANLLANVLDVERKVPVRGCALELKLAEVQGTRLPSKGKVGDGSRRGIRANNESSTFLGLFVWGKTIGKGAAVP